jgi:uncharacterized protein (TIGR02569 family)
MQYNVPNIDILRAFDVSGKPVRLVGGQGTSYLVDGVVLKPIDNEVEACWIADIYNNLDSSEFRVAKPVRAKNNSWVFDKWVAYNFINGEHLKNKHSETVEISKVFHKALEKIPKPSFLEGSDDAWAIADRIAWEESPIPKNKLTDEVFEKLFSNLQKNELPNQIIHGDIGENILFDSELAPAIIDFCPYWRPASFSIAVAIIDWIVWENADILIIDLYKKDKGFDQLLLRALIRRICEYIEHQKNNDRDYSGDMIKHVDITDYLIERIKKLSKEE